MSLFPLIILILDVSSKRIDPWWDWSWDTLPVWASGQGGSSPTGFPTESVDLYTKYPLMWTQGPLVFNNGTDNGYKTWNQGTISDANKIHAVNSKEPVLGYYGFQGCCYSHYDDWYPKYMNRSDLWLRDDSNAICTWDADGPPTTPFFDFCNPDLVQFFLDEILSPFMQSDSISGVFFDECDAFVDGPQAYWAPTSYDYDFSPQRQKEVRQCYIDGMVNITKYIASFNKWAIPSSYSLSKQSPQWEDAMDDVLINYGGFRYIEALECYGTGNIYNVSNEEQWKHIIDTNGFGTKEWKRLMEMSAGAGYNGLQDPDSFDCYAFNTQNECCQDMILTSMNVAKQGAAIMIRAQQKSHQYSQRYYATAAFLLMAYEWSYFAGGELWNGPSSFPWFDIYDYPIGEPQQDTQIHDKAQTIFSRQFKNVYVSFNLTQGVAAMYFNWNA